MRIPKTVNILGAKWRVKRAPLHKQRLYGKTVGATRTITIDSNLPPQLAEETFLHELMHACLWPEALPLDTEEHFIRLLSPRLLDVLKALK